MSSIDGAQASYYQAREKDFAQRWAQASAKWTEQAAPLKGVPIVVQHKAFTYLENWLGLVEVAALEPKPGVEPSGGYLATLKAQLAQQPAKAVVRAAYEDPRASQWLSEQSGIPAVVLPFTVGGNDKAKDLFGLFDSTVELLLGAGAAK
jgi:zinc/manganese transport system substrate-binding protein